MSVLRFLTDLVKSEASGQSPLDFQPYGQLTYKKSEGGWFGRLEGILPDNPIEICIEGDRNEKPSRRLEIVSEFITELDPLMERLFGYIHQNFLDSKWERSAEELREMYFLTAITLKIDGETFSVVLEPGFDVDSIFNQFLRFRLVKHEITWSNISN